MSLLPLCFNIHAVLLYNATMLKVIPSTKEQLIHFMISYISLGTYDKKFLNNLQLLNLVLGKPLTTNQADLLNKIVLRYFKQFSKLEIDANSMVALPWEKDPIPSLPEYTEAHLTLTDDSMILRSPYKKEFLSEFNKMGTYGVWHKDEKYWSIPANTFTLKSVTSLLEKHYQKINYCEKISAILADIKSYANYGYWDPTYTFNGRYLIKGINESLNNAINHITFDGELITLSRLVRYGINIDASVIDEYLIKYDSDFVDFAKDHKYTVEYGDMSIIDKIISIFPDRVVFGINSNQSVDYFNTLKHKLVLNGITCNTLAPNEYLDLNHKEYIIRISDKMFSQTTPVIAKTLNVVNSSPINIK